MQLILIYDAHPYVRRRLHSAVAGHEFAHAVPPQFLDHRQPVNRLLDGVMENMEPDQASVELFIIHHGDIISKADIGSRLFSLGAICGNRALA